MAGLTPVENIPSGPGGNPGGFGVGGGSDGGLLSGLLAGGGSIIGAAINSASQGATNEANIRMAREQMAFQEKMSNSAYQRSTSDMRAAGINPIMAYSQGGSSTPSGATTSIDNPNPGDSLKAAATTALELTRMNKDLEQQDSQIKLNEAAKKVQDHQADLTANNAAIAGEEKKIIQKTAPFQAQKAKAQATYEAKQAEWDKGAIDYDNVSKRLFEGLGGVSNAMSLRNFLRPSPKGTPTSPGNPHRQWKRGADGSVTNQKTGQTYRPKGK